MSDKAVSLTHVEMSNQLEPAMPEQQDFYAESIPVETEENVSAG